MGTTEPTDADLVARMRDGDLAAFRTLFDRHTPALRSRARSLVPRRLDRRVSVADVVQEARITAHAKMRGFRSASPGALRNWLMRIVELKAKEAVRMHADAAMRSEGREVSRGDRDDASACADPGPSPSEIMMADELAVAARRALATLSDDHREVLQLARVEGLSLADAAVRMGRSREATKKLYARAVARFARALAAEPATRPATRDARHDA